MSKKIAIVLATYNPNLEYFRKQIESIKNQECENWICHIVDDCSIQNYQTEIEKIIHGDIRFILHLHNNNLNHYYNFERGLNYCIEDTSIYAIALADQDDIWHPYKLSTLLERLDSEKALLVHSDLEMIDIHDKLINNSTWKFEKRNPEKLSTDLLLLRNVATGCSLIFCSSLLSDILPFPEQEEIYWCHDWWIALVASHKGKIEHIRKPLLQYRIHESNNIGAIKDAGKINGEFLLWMNKKFKIVGKGYLIHFKFSNAFYNRFYKDLDDKHWSNPFDDAAIDFGLNILKLGYIDFISGYNSEGIVFRLWILKILFDIQKIYGFLYRILKSVYQ